MKIDKKDYSVAYHKTKRDEFIDKYMEYYWNQSLSIRNTAKAIGISVNTLWIDIFKYNMKTRTIPEAQANRKRINKDRRTAYSKGRLEKSKQDSVALKKRWEIYKRHKDEFVKE